MRPVHEATNRNSFSFSDAVYKLVNKIYVPKEEHRPIVTRLPLKLLSRTHTTTQAFSQPPFLSTFVSRTKNKAIEAAATVVVEIEAL